MSEWVFFYVQMLFVKFIWFPQQLLMSNCICQRSRSWFHVKNIYLFKTKKNLYLGALQGNKSWRKECSFIFPHQNLTEPEAQQQTMGLNPANLL